MATSDWLLAVTLFSAPLLQLTFERAYDAVTSRNRRLWWMQHYRKITADFLDRVTAEREFEADRTEFERFHRNCKALVATWQCHHAQAQTMRKAA